MSDALVDWIAKKAAAQPKPKLEPSRWNAQERRALRTMRREAKASGATLATDGKGGLPPSLVLGVMRRDGYHCKVCGGQKNLGIHHKSEHLEDPRARARSKLLRREGRVDSPANLVTICESGPGYEGCHDRVHRRDREEHKDEQREQANGERPSNAGVDGS